MATAGELIHQKRLAFADFVQGALTARKLCTKELAEGPGLFEVRNRSIEEFVAFVVSDVSPYARNPGAYMTKLCSEWGVPAKSFDEAETARFERFLTFFIRAVQT